MTRRPLSAAILGALAAMVLAAPAGAATHPQVRVMTRNLYLGADLAPALTAQTPTALFEEAGQIYRDVQETNFPARAKVLAQEIAQEKPALVGFQEVALWRRGENGVVGGPPAHEVVYNFRDSLLHALDRAGLDYRAVASQREADFQIPVDFTQDGVADPSYDVRLTMRDMIIARAGVHVTNKMSGNYSTALPVPTPLGTINVKRGWASVDATVGGDSFRFVDTHLEAFNSIIRTAQASQLALPGGPLDTRMQVILVGDLNSDPTIAPDQNNPTISDENAYDQFANAGFADRGVSVDTCCHDADLLDAGGQFTERIDHVLTKPPLVQVSNDLTGDDPALRTPFGLWPSDHGGVVSTLRLP